ncbi:MAG: D-glucuronyl C5-epimerase family protein [Methanobacteriaceae archaeon]
MNKWFLVVLAVVVAILLLAVFLNQSLTDEEKTILTRGDGVPFYEQLELLMAFYDHNMVRKSLLNKYHRTDDSEYKRSYLDSGYTVNAFFNLSTKRKLTSTEFKILTVTLKANNAYYSHQTSPEGDGVIGTFSSQTPYPTTNTFVNSKFKSKLPFVYYQGQGWQFYPVTATFWASEYFKQGDYPTGMELLDELSPYMSFENYNGTDYGVFKVYFQYTTSDIPWASSYSQGLATGLYAQAYNHTKNRKYLDQSNLLFNSFKVPQSDGGFITSTRFGPWFLEYNFKPQHLILNGHLITMQGIYSYYQVTKNPEALTLFNQGAASVKNILPQMDSGSWSYYALTGDYARPAWNANKYYMSLHVELLNWLYSATADPTFQIYAQRWDGYLKSNTGNVSTKIITMP